MLHVVTNFEFTYDIFASTVFVIIYEVWSENKNKSAHSSIVAATPLGRYALSIPTCILFLAKNAVTEASMSVLSVTSQCLFMPYFQLRQYVHSLYSTMIKVMRFEAKIYISVPFKCLNSLSNWP